MRPPSLLPPKPQQEGKEGRNGRDGQDLLGVGVSGSPLRIHVHVTVLSTPSSVAASGEGPSGNTAAGADRGLHGGDVLKPAYPPPPLSSSSGSNSCGDGRGDLRKGIIKECDAKAAVTSTCTTQDSSSSSSDASAIHFAPSSSSKAVIPGGCDRCGGVGVDFRLLAPRWWGAFSATWRPSDAHTSTYCAAEHGDGAQIPSRQTPQSQRSDSSGVGASTAADAFADYVGARVASSSASLPRKENGGRVTDDRSATLSTARVGPACPMFAEEEEGVDLPACGCMRKRFTNCNRNSSGMCNDKPRSEQRLQRGVIDLRLLALCVLLDTARIGGSSAGVGNGDEVGTRRHEEGTSVVLLRRVALELVGNFGVIALGYASTTIATARSQEEKGDAAEQELRLVRDDGCDDAGGLETCENKKSGNLSEVPQSSGSLSVSPVSPQLRTSTPPPPTETERQYDRWKVNKQTSSAPLSSSFEAENGDKVDKDAATNDAHNSERRKQLVSFADGSAASSQESSGVGIASQQILPFDIDNIVGTQQRAVAMAYSCTRTGAASSVPRRLVGDGDGGDGGDCYDASSDNDDSGWPLLDTTAAPLSQDNAVACADGEKALVRRAIDIVFGLYRDYECSNPQCLCNARHETATVTTDASNRSTASNGRFFSHESENGGRRHYRYRFPLPPELQWRRLRRSYECEAHEDAVAVCTDVASATKGVCLSLGDEREEDDVDGTGDISSGSQQQPVGTPHFTSFPHGAPDDESPPLFPSDGTPPADEQNVGHISSPTNAANSCNPAHHTCTAGVAEVSINGDVAATPLPESIGEEEGALLSLQTVSSIRMSAYAAASLPSQPAPPFMLTPTPPAVVSAVQPHRHPITPIATTTTPSPTAPSSAAKGDEGAVAPPSAAAVEAIAALREVKVRGGDDIRQRERYPPAMCYELSAVSSKGRGGMGNEKVKRGSGALCPLAGVIAFVGRAPKRPRQPTEAGEGALESTSANALGGHSHGGGEDEGNAGEENTCMSSAPLLSNAEGEGEGEEGRNPHGDDSYDDDNAFVEAMQVASTADNTFGGRDSRPVDDDNRRALLNSEGNALTSVTVTFSTTRHVGEESNTNVPLTTVFIASSPSSPPAAPPPSQQSYDPPPSHFTAGVVNGGRARCRTMPTPLQSRRRRNANRIDDEQRVRGATNNSSSTAAEGNEGFVVDVSEIDDGLAAMPQQQQDQPSFVGIAPQHATTAIFREVVGGDDPSSSSAAVALDPTTTVAGMDVIALDGPMLSYNATTVSAGDSSELFANGSPAVPSFPHASSESESHHHHLQQDSPCSSENRPQKRRRTRSPSPPRIFPFVTATSRLTESLIAEISSFSTRLASNGHHRSACPPTDTSAHAPVVHGPPHPKIQVDQPTLQQEASADHHQQQRGDDQQTLTDQRRHHQHEARVLSLLSAALSQALSTCSIALPAPPTPRPAAHYAAVAAAVETTNRIGQPAAIIASQRSSAADDSGGEALLRHLDLGSSSQSKPAHAATHCGGNSSNTSSSSAAAAAMCTGCSSRLSAEPLSHSSQSQGAVVDLSAGGGVAPTSAVVGAMGKEEEEEENVDKGPTVVAAAPHPDSSSSPAAGAAASASAGGSSSSVSVVAASFSPAASTSASSPHSAGLEIGSDAKPKIATTTTIATNAGSGCVPLCSGSGSAVPATVSSSAATASRGSGSGSGRKTSAAASAGSASTAGLLSQLRGIGDGWPPPRPTELLRPPPLLVDAGDPRATNATAKIAVAEEEEEGGRRTADAVSSSAASPRPSISFLGIHHAAAATAAGSIGAVGQDGEGTCIADGNTRCSDNQCTCAKSTFGCSLTRRWQSRRRATHVPNPHMRHNTAPARPRGAAPHPNVGSKRKEAKRKARRQGTAIIVRSKRSEKKASAAVIMLLKHHSIRRSGLARFVDSAANEMRPALGSSCPVKRVESRIEGGGERVHQGSNDERRERNDEANHIRGAHFDMPPPLPPLPPSDVSFRLSRAELDSAVATAVDGALAAHSAELREWVSDCWSAMRDSCAEALAGALASVAAMVAEGHPPYQPRPQ